MKVHGSTAGEEHLSMDIEELAGASSERNLTLLEKILAQHVDPPGSRFTVGSYVNIVPRYVMTHDNTAAVIAKFDALGAKRINNPHQLVFCLDHDIQNTAQDNLDRYTKIEHFAKSAAVDFYAAGRGIGHQVLVEEGYVLPGTVVVASDSHSNMYGAMACLGTPVVRTDAACIWATGMTWWKVPPAVKISLTGSLDKGKGVRGKDIIVGLCGFLNNDQVLNCAVEFDGPGVASLSMDERMTISNMSTEWGAPCAIFPVDQVTISYLEHRATYLAASLKDEKCPATTARRLKFIQKSIQSMTRRPLQADLHATYHAEYSFNLESISSSIVCGPHNVKTLATNSRQIPIDKAYLISCVNSRVEDLKDAASVLKDKRIHPRVQMYIAAASSEVERESEMRGDWGILVSAGCTPLPPGCGPCIGLGLGTMEPGEVGISSTNRNFRGRMGSRDAEVYLASPRLVAQSAVQGFIRQSTDRPNLDIVKLGDGTDVSKSTGYDREPLVPGFPAQIRGNVIFCPQKGISTDGIFAGDKTYCTMTPQEMSNVAMANYDPQFQQKLRSSAGPKVLVGGENFGVGSSREQAAQCFKGLDIEAIVVSSVGATYTRNAINNGLPLVECDRLVKKLDDAFDIDHDSAIGEDNLTCTSTDEVILDFVNWQSNWRGQSFPMRPIGQSAQKILVAGGLDGWIRQQLG